MNNLENSELLHNQNGLESNNLGGKIPHSDSQGYTLKPEFDFSSNISPTDIKEEVDHQIEQSAKNEENKGIFKVRTANEWIEQAKNRPIPNRLFDDFMFEGELCILYADTNLGKSILATQIANSICEGSPIKGFKLEANKQKVLYLDFELSDKQFENRYSKDFDQHYKFDKNFLRAEIDPEKSDFKEYGFKTFEEFLYNSIEKTIITTNAKVLIIDNITYLKDETEKAKFALPLMKYLQGLKKKYGLSILVLAHTPKRDLSKPITRNDLSGSKMLINFCDSAFSIGESYKDKSLRYLKQIKSRNTEIIYDTENVCICQIGKSYNFLQFEFLNYGTEQEHLKLYTEAEKEKRISEALELKEKGLSNVKIAQQLGVSEGAIRKWIKKDTENEPELPF